jgi:hypothetical protein
VHEQLGEADGVLIRLGERLLGTGARICLTFAGYALVLAMVFPG